MSQCGHIFLDDLNDPLNTPSSSNSFTRPLIKKNNVKTQFGIIDYSRNKTNPLAQIPRLSVQQETLPVFFNMDKTNKKKIEALPKESNSKAKSSTNILNHNIAIEEPKQSQTPMIMNKLLRLNKYSSCSSFIMFNQDNLLPKRLLGFIEFSKIFLIENKYFVIETESCAVVINSAIGNINLFFKSRLTIEYKNGFFCPKIFLIMLPVASKCHIG